MEQWKIACKITLLIAFLIFIFWVIVRLSSVFSLIIFSLLIVYCLIPLVNALVKYKFPRTVAVVLVFFSTFFMIALVLFLVPPLLFKEIRQLAGFIAIDLRVFINYLLGRLRELDIIYDLGLVQILSSTIISFIDEIPLVLTTWIRRNSTFNIPFLSSIWAAFGLFFLVFYFLLDMERIKQSFVNFLPEMFRRDAAKIIAVVDAKVGAYLRGNLLRCSIVGLFTWSFLAIIGMPFSFVLALVAALLNIIPNIGPFLAAIPAVLISITPQTPHPLLVVLVYLVIQTVDPFLLTPLLLGKAVDLRPITVIIAILIGAKLMGLLGVLLAIPLTAVGKVMLQYYYFPCVDKFFCPQQKENAPPPETEEH